MPNDATQNPTNRWARNSGAGTGGVSQVIPTRAEAGRGLQPFSLDETGDAARAIGLGLAMALGAILAGAVVWRARQPQDLPTRVMRKIRRR
jgi:hypothetical protein